MEIDDERWKICTREKPLPYLPDDHEYFAFLGITLEQACEIAKRILSRQIPFIRANIRYGLQKALKIGYWRLRGLEAGQEPTLLLFYEDGRIARIAEFESLSTEVCWSGYMMTQYLVAPVVIKMTKLNCDPSILETEFKIALDVQTKQARDRHSLRYLVRPLLCVPPPFTLICYQECQLDGRRAPTLEHPDIVNNLMIGFWLWILAGYALLSHHKDGYAHGDFRGSEVCVTNHGVKIIDLGSRIGLYQPVLFSPAATEDGTTHVYVGQSPAVADEPRLRAHNAAFYRFVDGHVITADAQEGTMLTCPGLLQAADIRAYALAFLDFLFMIHDPTDYDRHKIILHATSILDQREEDRVKFVAMGTLGEAELLLDQVCNLLRKLIAMPNDELLFEKDLDILKDLYRKLRSMTKYKF